MNGLLNKYQFHFKKGYGQNFLTDTNLLRAITTDAGITANDVVLEIGAGAGALTQQLAKVAKRVVVYEIDTNLKPILEENLKEFQNVTLVFQDFMRVSAQNLQNEVGTTFKVVANLPYYITTPILFKLLEETTGLQSITIMVQKEVGERIVAPSGNKEYGVLSVMLQHKGSCSIKRMVKRNMFTPAPKVDSCIVHIQLYTHTFACESMFQKVVKQGFSMRRKQLANVLQQTLGVAKETIHVFLEKQHLPLTARAEELTVAQFEALAMYLQENT